MATPAPDYALIKQRQQRTWATGDFSAIATPMTNVGEMLCEAIDLHAGSRVLDVACGSGNTALAAARCFCDVTGIDYVPSLLERARERADAERLAITFVEGDAEALPFEDDGFDVVLSSFGVMFAPNQAQAASEMLRVCRSGGTIGLANWTPEGMVGDIFRATAAYNAPPPGLTPPVRWGTEEGLKALLGEGVESLRVERRFKMMRYRSPEQWLNLFREFFGPIATTFAALDNQGRDGFAADLLAVIGRHNRASDGTVIVPAEYAEVVAIRR